MLEFKRTSRFNKDNAGSKVRKDWISTKPPRYHITWRKMVCGVHVAPGFRATCLCYVPGNFEGGKHEMWAFVDAKKQVFKTFKKAQEVCEQHYRSWEKAIQCPSMRALKSLFKDRRPSEIPVWIYNRLNRSILSVLMDSNARKYREEEDDISYFETDFVPEPEAEVGAEKKTRRRKLKVVEEAMGTPLSIELPKKRKERADKGKPRKKQPSDKVPDLFNRHSISSNIDSSFPLLKQMNETPPVAKKRGRPKGSKNKVKK
jgi:hypothetical protein